MAAPSSVAPALGGLGGHLACFKGELCPPPGGGRGLVEAVPVALLRVVLQLRSHAAHPLQEHGGAVVPVCGTRGGDNGKWGHGNPL